MINQWGVPSDEMVALKEYLRKYWWVILVILIIFAVVPILSDLHSMARVVGVQPSECTLLCSMEKLDFFKTNMYDCYCIDYSKCIIVENYKYCKGDAVMIYERMK
jgi:hypothetical protein